MHALLLSCICNCIIGTIRNWELFFHRYLWFRFEEIRAPQGPVRETGTEEDGWLQGKEQRWFRDSSDMCSHRVSEGEWAGRCAESRGTENTAALGPGHWFVRLCSMSPNQPESAYVWAFTCLERVQRGCCRSDLSPLFSWECKFPAFAALMGWDTVQLLL